MIKTNYYQTKIWARGEIVSRGDLRRFRLRHHVRNTIPVSAEVKKEKKTHGSWRGVLRRAVDKCIRCEQAVETLRERGRGEEGARGELERTLVREALVQWEGT